MRQLILSPRWIVWHLLTLGAMATCGWLAAWQWQRAGSSMGSVLNVGYGLQWPVFAVFFGVMWWRMLRMEAASLRGEDPTAPASKRAAPEPGEPVVAEPRSAEPRSAEPRSAEPRSAEPRSAEPRAVAADGPSPFTARPAAAAPPVTDEDDPELADYNRMLARLAARNPEN